MDAKIPLRGSLLSAILQVYGKTGYLGEYELSSIVSEQVANGRKEYSGPLTVKHVGLCNSGRSEGNNRSN